LQNPSIMKPVLILSGAAVLLAAMYLGASVIAPVLQAYFLATLLTPLYNGLKRRKVPAGLALLLSIGLLVLVGLFLALLIGRSLTTLKSSLTTYSDEFVQRQAEVAAKIDSVSQMENFDQLAAAADPQKLESVLAFFLEMIGGVLRSFTLILIMTIFILVEGPLFLRRMRSAFGVDHFLPRNMVTLSGMMVNYFALRALVNLVTATATGLMLWLLGVDYAGLWAVLIFFLSFIPYVGAFLAMIPPVLLAYAESGLGVAILVGLLSVVINGAAENIVAPMVMGKGLAISPTVIFVSFIFWMFILGGPGALLAVPLTMAVTTFMSSFEETRSFAALLVTTSDPDPKAKPVLAQSGG
jgi:AI-2 transport protein TqsA